MDDIKFESNIIGEIKERRDNLLQEIKQAIDNMKMKK